MTLISYYDPVLTLLLMVWMLSYKFRFFWINGSCEVCKQTTLFLFFIPSCRQGEATTAPFSIKGSFQAEFGFSGWLVSEKNSYETPLLYFPSIFLQMNLKSGWAWLSIVENVRDLLLLQRGHWQNVKRKAHFSLRHEWKGRTKINQTCF